MPALERVGYDVKRADSDLDQQNVLKDVVRGVARADLVIAELTSRNPNVLYELGLSHALRRNTVLITQSMDDIPFDLRTYRVISYSTQFDSADKLSEQLESIGEARRENAIDFGSPIVDFLPDAGAESNAVDGTGQSRQGHVPTDHARSDPLEEGSGDDDAGVSDGYLDAILAVESANAQITERMQAIGESTQKIGERFQAKTQEANDVQAGGGPGVLAAAHRIAGEVGRSLDEYAAELNVEAPLLEKDVEQLINGGLAFTAWLAEQEDIDPAEAVSTRDSLLALKSAVGEGLEAVGGFRRTLVDLSGISRDMARGTGRAITALDRISGALEQVEAFTEKAVGLLEERIPADYASPVTDEDEERDSRDGIDDGEARIT